MLLSLYFPVPCNPSRAVTLPKIKFLNTSEFPNELPTHNRFGLQECVKRSGFWLTYVYIYICIHTYVYVYVYIYIYVYMYTYMCIYLYIYICLYVFLYVYVYIYIYIYIYIYVHRFRGLSEVFEVAELELVV